MRTIRTILLGTLFVMAVAACEKKDEAKPAAKKDEAAKMEAGKMEGGQGKMEPAKTEPAKMEAPKMEGGAEPAKMEGGEAAKAPEGGAPKSLFDRLGGQAAIEAVVGDFLTNVAGDARINKRFAKTDIPRLKKMLVDQVCQATGGPCKYEGKSMVDAHKGMKITEEEFTALVEDLVKSLDKFKVPEAEKGELLGALGGMKADIVGK